MKTCTWVLAALTLLWAGCDRASVDAGNPPKANNATADASALEKLGDAPAWQLTRLDGQTLKSEDLRGQVVVIDFWATWCGPCVQEIPGYVELQRTYGDRGLTIVGISLDQGGTSVVEKFVQRHNVNYPIVMGDAAVAEAFGGVQAIPTTFLIDREGQIRHRKVGAMEKEEYETLITSLL